MIHFVPDSFTTSQNCFNFKKILQCETNMLVSFIHIFQNVIVWYNSFFRKQQKEITQAFILLKKTLFCGVMRKERKMLFSVNIFELLEIMKNNLLLLHTFVDCDIILLQIYCLTSK